MEVHPFTFSKCVVWPSLAVARKKQPDVLGSGSWLPRSLAVAREKRKKGSSYFGARKLLDKLTGVVQNGPAWEGGQHSSVTFRIFSIYFICVCLYSWKRRNSHFICLCKFFRWFPKYQVGKFFYLFLGDRILTNWTDKKSCCKSNGHRCLATKAEHLPPLQKQPCRSSGTR